MRAGRCAIRRLSAEELKDEDPALAAHPNYVPFAAPLQGYASFDPEFFGFSPKEAAILDPQHRRFLETAWAALENAGCDPSRFRGRIGVFAGCGQGSYFWVNLLSHPELVAEVGHFLLRHTGNDKDFLATRVAHVFDLRGPAIGIQTACSTSLVAVHFAVQALLAGECDFALAGGVTIELPQGRGYLYKENEILSPDGVCRAFDHRAKGTVFGSGAGVVALRRLSDALRAGDHIWAVIRGTAVNNDGAQKAGYLAPSVEGQAACVAEALAMAGVSAETLGYVEAHGTGTYLGDPIEVAALTQAFRKSTTATGYCWLGSVKTNIGHTDTAAGVIGLIKAALALYYGEIPPSLHFEAPNPAIDFENSPFRVADTLIPWPRARHPRRAGVNSLGVGGTNAFAVLEEAPPRAPSEPSDWPYQIITVSARSKSALEATAKALAAHLQANPTLDLADVAFTLKEGRKAFENRRVVVAETAAEAARLLIGQEPRRMFDHTALDSPEVVFMFPGGGAQYPGMARGLYETEPVFADWMERGLNHLAPKLDQDIRALWLPAPGREAEAAQALTRPSLQLPLLFIIEIALAHLLQSWGVRPGALIGHSMGENAAACFAGVMRFEEGIDLVLKRGQLFERVPRGGMLSVPLAAETLLPRVERFELDIAAVNAPELAVVSGPEDALAAFAAELAGKGIECQRIAIDIAAHSRMLEPILPEFRAHLATMRLMAPSIPIISNRTGQPLSAEEATSPAYWTAHLRHSVRFADGIRTLAAQKNRVFVEVGPGRALSSLTRQQVPGNQVLGALRHPDDRIADDRHHLELLGRLSALGVEVDWSQIWGQARRKKLPLPGYAFQRKEFFIAPSAKASAAAAPITREAELRAWGWRLSWWPEAAPCPLDVSAELWPPKHWLVFADRAFAPPAIRRLREGGHRVTEVRLGDGFARHPLGYLLDPGQGREGFERLVQDLLARGEPPERIALFWPCAPTAQVERTQRQLERGFYSLIHLAQAWTAEAAPNPEQVVVFTTGGWHVRAQGGFFDATLVAGPVRTLPQELGWPVAWADLPPLDPKTAPNGELTRAVLEELLGEPGSREAVWRGGRRLVRRLEPAPLAPADPLPEGSVWLITGGFGGIGLTLAEALVRQKHARVALVGRRLPSPESTRAGRLAMLLESGQVMARAADVCSLEAMQHAVAEIRALWGQIDGVIHAAGQIDDAPLLAKSVADLEAVLAPKLHGLKVLDRLFPDGSLSHLVLFSSSSTLVPPAGQTDYIAANEVFNAYALARAHDRTKVQALVWGVWADIGMAAKAVADQAEGEPLAPKPPLLATQSRGAGGRIVLHTTLSPGDWLVDEHRTAQGQALVPGTGVVELLLEAADVCLRGSEAGAPRPSVIEDLTLLRPIPVGKATPLRIVLEPHGKVLRARVESEVEAEGRRGWLLHAEARFVPYMGVGAEPSAPRLDLAALTARLSEKVLADEAGLKIPQEAHLRFGPRWRVLRRIAYGGNEGLALLRLPDAFAGDLDAGFRAHPALVDMATGFALPLVQGYDPADLWVPVGYDRICLLASVPAEVICHARAAPAEGGVARFDLVLAAPDGQVVLEIRGFAMRRLLGGFAALPPPKAAEIHSEPPRSLSLHEIRFRRNLALGITAAEGVEAFVRALGRPEPVVAISPIPLPALQEEAANSRFHKATIASEAVGEAEGRSAQQGPVRFARPTLATPYVAPRTPLEQTLAGFFEELLGIESVGVDDDFFDLGGHSLIAVRLFARIKRAFAVDLPLSALFEAPSVAKIAALIVEQGGLAALDSDAAAPSTSAGKRRFRYLVPMQEPENAARLPFFMVAGMFGNVLNLRQLAVLMGRDRPFYGLQARGLTGEDEPHQRLDEAARDYLAEVRAIQPKGPYLLGGFSGGGLTALEMAQALREQGEEVALLVLLDTPLPERPRLALLDRALIKWAELRRAGPRYLRDWLEARRDWAEAQRWAEPTEASPHNRRVEAAFREALRHVRLRRYEGQVALFRPPLDRHWRVFNGRWVSREREYVFPDNGWGVWMPKLSIYEVPGDHDSMVLEPNVRVLAEILRQLCEACDRAEAQAGRANPAFSADQPNLHGAAVALGVEKEEVTL